MLQPGQVLPFLTFPDPNVREQAAEYFTDLGDASPIETADELWRAIDLFGEHLSEVKTKQRLRFLRALAEVPLNDSSVTRTIEYLRSADSDPDLLFNIRKVLERIPIDLLRSRREEILPLASPECRSALEHRLALTLLPPEELWQQFEALGDEADEQDVTGEAHVMEALCRHPDFVIPLATEVLVDPGDREFFELWCVELLGRLRHAPSIGLIAQKLKIDDADVLRETAGDALSRMDPAAAVPALEAAYPSDDPFDRMDIGDALGRIKHPLAEAALLRLLAVEENQSAATNLCIGLCSVCTTEGLEQLRQIVVADCYDATLADIKEMLVTICTMTGFEPPELREWKSELASPGYKEAMRKKVLAAFGMERDTLSKFQKYLATGSLDDEVISSATTELVSQPQVAVPFRREQPKIGRNDPCPCGSGKKYKKCCGA
jgi:HEAT repeat protein